jgi:hypothetical protein
MQPSLNLTPARGPSVWVRMDRESAAERRWLAMIAGGAVVIAATSAMRRPSNGRAWVAALGLACVAGGVLGRARSRGLPAALHRIGRPSDTGVVDAAIDQASADSFPASDAPSSMLRP